MASDEPGVPHPLGSSDRPDALHHDNPGELHRLTAAAGADAVDQVGGAWPERAVQHLGVRQKLIVTRVQLRRLGVSRGAIEYALRTGRLFLLHRGVYTLVPPHALPAEARELAAVLACSDRALLDGHHAAAMWGVRPAALGDIHVVVAGAAAARSRPGIIVHRSSTLIPLDCRKLRGVPIVCAPRAMLEIAVDLTARELERALDEGIAKGLVSRSSLQDQVQRNPRRAGALRLRALLEAGRKPTLTRSEIEEAMLGLVRRGGLPPPEVNVKLGGYTADFLWRSHKVIVEVDSWIWHHGRWAFDRDRRRDTKHQAMGFLVLRFSDDQLDDTPELVLAQTAAVLARRESVA